MPLFSLKKQQYQTFSTELDLLTFSYVLFPFFFFHFGFSVMCCLFFRVHFLLLRYIYMNFIDRMKFDVLVDFWSDWYFYTYVQDAGQQVVTDSVQTLFSHSLSFQNEIKFHIEYIYTLYIYVHIEIPAESSLLNNFRLLNYFRTSKEHKTKTCCVGLWYRILGNVFQFHW